METVPDKQHAHELIERLQTSQISTAVRFLEFMLLDPVARAVATAPPDDEAVIEQDRRRWLDEAKADVRALDRPTAMRLFEGTLHFARTGSGNVNALHGDMAGAFRLRLGDYRVLFTLERNVMRIFGVRHRSEAYR